MGDIHRAIATFIQDEASKFTQAAIDGKIDFSQMGTYSKDAFAPFEYLQPGEAKGLADRYQRDVLDKVTLNSYAYKPGQTGYKTKASAKALLNAGAANALYERVEKYQGQEFPAQFFDHQSLANPEYANGTITLNALKPILTTKFMSQLAQMAQDIGMGDNVFLVFGQSKPGKKPILIYPGDMDRFELLKAALKVGALKISNRTSGSSVEVGSHTFWTMYQLDATRRPFYLALALFQLINFDLPQRSLVLNKVVTDEYRNRASAKTPNGGYSTPWAIVMKIVNLINSGFPDIDTAQVNGLSKAFTLLMKSAAGSAAGDLGKISKFGADLGDMSAGNNQAFSAALFAASSAGKPVTLDAYRKGMKGMHLSAGTRNAAGLYEEVKNPALVQSGEGGAKAARGVYTVGRKKRIGGANIIDQLYDEDGERVGLAGTPFCGGSVVTATKLNGPAFDRVLGDTRYGVNQKTVTCDNTPWGNVPSADTWKAVMTKAELKNASAKKLKKSVSGMVPSENLLAYGAAINDLRGEYGSLRESDLHSQSLLAESPEQRKAVFEAYKKLRSKKVVNDLANLSGGGSGLMRSV